MSVSDTDWQLLSARVAKLEEQIKTLTNQPRHAPWQSDDRSKPYYRSPYTAYKNSYQLSKEAVPCFFDNIPEKDRVKPMGISCPCPKCTPYCM